ncbi:CidA/LrgA family protein [Lachnoclostridium edouardi]|uniref:CidA/LrgA family protein n=1 Tax=Lachnoclostridium edouardi TaxID=1926283 RepID=UPI000C7B8870|nr:CidA/LrgA family protein [Lachnoclostridium edouardi]
MKYVKEIALILGVSLAGEFLNQTLPLPVPAGVYGLFLLLAGLLTGIVKIEHVDDTGNWLLDTMPLMFVPVSVGLMESFGELKGILLPFVFISFISTVIVMAVTGLLAEWIIKRKMKNKETEV